MNHSGGVPFLSIEEQRKELGWEGLSKLLTQLPPRHFWYRSRTRINPVYQQAFSIPDPPYSMDFKTRVAAVYDISGKRYGRLKTDAQHEVSRNSTYASRDSGNYPNSNETETGEAPFWGR